jgi:transcriptional regulator with XRE-family HTH domain
MVLVTCEDLRKWRESRNLSRYGAARLFNITLARYTKWELGLTKLPSNIDEFRFEAERTQFGCPVRAQPVKWRA